MSDDITRDSISEGALEVLQRRDGYRFGVDAVLLATDLPEFNPKGTVVELGAGQGVPSMCVATRFPAARVVAVERQASLLELLERNVALNGLEGRVAPVGGDIREPSEALEPHAADLVICNPPYYREGERRTSEDAERAAARNELAGTLADFVRAAAYTLTQRGRLKIVVPPLRLGDLYAAAASTDLSFETLRHFHSRRDSDAYLVEAVLRRGGAPDVRIRPPLYVYGDEGDSSEGSKYGPEVRRRIDGAARDGEVD